jgi:hypothetical protein
MAVLSDLPYATWIGLFCVGDHSLRCRVQKKADGVSAVLYQDDGYGLDGSI